jgi:hypothetical protein
MKGVAIDVQFVSMLALAQKAAATGGLERLAALIGSLVSVFPQAKDLLNVDNYVREMSELLGNPQKILMAPEEVMKSRQAQAQAAQQAHQQEAMAQGTQTAATGAQAAQVLSQTQVGSGGDALSMLLGAGGKANLK